MYASADTHLPKNLRHGSEEGEQEEAFTSIATTLLFGGSGEAGADERRGTQEKRERLLFVRLRRHKTSQEVLLRGRRTPGGVHLHRNDFVGWRIHRRKRPRRLSSPRDVNEAMGLKWHVDVTRKVREGQIHRCAREAEDDR